MYRDEISKLQQQIPLLQLEAEQELLDKKKIM
jgi:hypothetical protein